MIVALPGHFSGHLLDYLLLFEQDETFFESNHLLDYLLLFEKNETFFESNHLLDYLLLFEQNETFFESNNINSVTIAHLISYVNNKSSDQIAYSALSAIIRS